MSKISIVVPIFNVEHYLKRCLDSIVAQKYEDYEVLLVNDGSTDGSRDIAQKYLADSRFKLIDQQNAGLSAARNTGIAQAKGKYTYLLDSDDWIAPDLLATVIAQFQKNEADLLFFNFFLAKNPNDYVKERWFTNRPEGMKEPLTALKALFSNQIGNFAWSYVCKTTLYQDKDIYFPVGRSYEDLGTTYKLIAAAQKIYFSKDTLYYYFQENPNSITRTWKPRNYRECLQTYHEIENYLSNYYPADHELQASLYNQKFSSLIMHLELSRKSTSYVLIWAKVKQLKGQKIFHLARGNNLKFWLIKFHLYWKIKNIKKKLVGQ